MEEQHRPGPPPQYSPDGRWWWNGSHWVPAPPSTPPTTSPGKQPLTAKQLVGIIIGVAVVVFAGVTIHQDEQRQDQVGDDLDRILCEDYDSC
ncbi:hypothetical protein AB0N29_01775 [Nocardioides sp. NPDC092400]|uniref:hypothetical protein n=1 Tax=Nocardioides sp. NPDC092400 TaxID=3155196 RepID=UPI00342D237F